MRTATVRHGELRVVVPAVDVVHAPGLADADQHAVQRRLGGVELVEPGGVHVPQLGVLGVERSEPVGEVLLERRGEGEHVGAQEHLHAEFVGAVPERSERLAQRERLRAVLVALGVHRPAGDVVEGHELDEARERDRVVAVGERVPDEEVEVLIRSGERLLIDVRRLRQQHVRERLGRVRVVRAGSHAAGSGLTPTAPMSTMRNGSREVTSSPRCSATDRPVRTCAARS